MSTALGLFHFILFVIFYDNILCKKGWKSVMIVLVYILHYLASFCSIPLVSCNLLSSFSIWFMTFDVVSHVEAVCFCQGKSVSAVKISHGVYKEGYISDNKNKTI